MSRSLAVLVAGIAAVVMVLSKFIVPMESAETTVAEWFNAMAAIAFVLGGASLLKMNLLAISARGPGWGYAAVTLVTFLVTLGVGLPFIVKAHGGDPAVMGTLGMLSGYCGTLVTPMAANFNLVPARLLELRDDFAVIKSQVPFAAAIWVFNVVVMYVCVFRR